MKPITWNPRLSSCRNITAPKEFTKSLRQFAEKHLSAIDISKIAKSIYDLNWSKCHNCEINCETCPHPPYEFNLTIEIPETLPSKNILRRVFYFETNSDGNSGFSIQFVEFNRGMIAMTNEISFSDYGVNKKNKVKEMSEEKKIGILMKEVDALAKELDALRKDIIPLLKKIQSNSIEGIIKFYVEYIDKLYPFHELNIKMNKKILQISKIGIQMTESDIKSIEEFTKIQKNALKTAEEFIRSVEEFTKTQKNFSKTTEEIIKIEKKLLEALAKLKNNEREI